MFDIGEKMVRIEFDRHLREKKASIVKREAQFVLYRTELGEYILLTSQISDYIDCMQISLKFVKDSKVLHYLINHHITNLSLFYSSKETKTWIECQGDMEIEKYIDYEERLLMKLPERAFEFGIREADYSVHAQDTYGKFVREDDRNLYLSLTTKHTLYQEIRLLREIIDERIDSGTSTYYPYIFELKLDRHCIDKLKAMDLLKHKNVYYRVEFVDEEKPLLEETILVSGTLFVTDGLLKMVQKKVIIHCYDTLEEEMKQFEKYREKVFRSFCQSLQAESAKKMIAKHMGEKADKIAAETLFVGQANCTKVIFGEKGSDEPKQGYVDIGVTPFYEQEYRMAQTIINLSKEKMHYEKKVDFFIISHVHFDHLAGFSFFKKETLIHKKPLWIFQDVLSFVCIGKYIDSILIYLILNKVDLLLVTHNDAIYEGSSFTISRGQNRMKRNINQTSIVVTLNGQYEKMLLSSDCSYRSYHPYIFSKGPFKYIVCSHHGEVIDLKNSEQLKKLSNPGTIGIFSSGYNAYAYPKRSHLGQFRESIVLNCFERMSYYIYL